MGTIAKSCMQFANERKIFTGGLIYFNMEGIAYCGQFMKKLIDQILEKSKNTDVINKLNDMRSLTDIKGLT